MCAQWNCECATITKGTNQNLPSYLSSTTTYTPKKQERVAFTPHPKTLTMAGDYEYFAAQGHHPLAFALAELVDNAIRATKGNAG